MDLANMSKIIVDCTHGDTNSWSTLAAIASTMIALVALFFSFYSAHQQQIHNKNSVRPIFDIASDTSPISVSVRFTNMGPGPMKITKMRFLYDGNEYCDMVQVLPKLKLVEYTNALTNAENHYYPAVSNTSLFATAASSHHITGNGPTPALVSSIKSLVDVVNATTLVVTYEDIYGTVFGPEEHHFTLE